MLDHVTKGSLFGSTVYGKGEGEVEIRYVGWRHCGANLYIITLRLSVRPDVPVFLKKYPADFSETLHESSVW